LKNLKKLFFIFVQKFSHFKFHYAYFPQKRAAKERLNYQLRNTDSGQFALQYSNSEDEYTPSSNSDYSTDISDEGYCTQRMLKLGDISFALTGFGYLFG